MRIIFLIVLSLKLFGNVIIAPDLTEAETDKYTKYYVNFESNAWSEYDIFNGELAICKAVEMLKNRFNLTAAVETGTYHGTTTEFLSSFFPKVFTIEKNVSYFNMSKKNLSSFPNVSMILGNSGDCLGDVLKKLNGERVFFYLDAHWGSYWPLKDELVQISQYCKDNCVILIDDIKVPGESTGYGRCGDLEFSYPNIKDFVDRCFSEHNYYYLITNMKFRGKVLLIPKSYAKDLLTKEMFD